MLKVLGLGFASGLPIAFTASVLITYLAENKLDLKTVGLFSMAGLPYTIKFLWAPLLDNMRIPYFTKLLGMRKGWILLLQLILMSLIYSLGQVDINNNLLILAMVAVLIAIFSASQDIVIDAFRIEMLSQEDQGAGVAVAAFGYRMGSLLAGAGSLFIAHYYDWETAYTVMALTMIIGLVATLSCVEASRVIPKFESIDVWMKHAFINPFGDFLKRKNWYNTVLLIIFFKMSDAFSGVMTNPFLLDIGFDKKEIATIVKLYGVNAIFLGFFIGGIMIKRLDYLKALLWGCLLQMLSNLVFVLQAKVGHDVTMLIINISIENLASGIGSAVLMAYMGHICNKNFVLTQYALFSALAGTVRTTIAGFSGVMAQYFGWVDFFMLSVLMSSPVLYFLYQESKVSKIQVASKHK